MGWDRARTEQVNATMLKAYRWQYIVSGTLEPRLQKVLAKLVSAQQWARIQAALCSLRYAVPTRTVGHRRRSDAHGALSFSRGVG
jgi:hypothetical protein